MSDEWGEGVGQEKGLVAWRIEKKVPTRVPQSKLHLLYTGDSYIFLYTVEAGKKWFVFYTPDCKARFSLVRPIMCCPPYRNIHFWLGKESSQDEIGIAAYKTVELDENVLGGGPAQYREVSSGWFLSDDTGTSQLRYCLGARS
jgi:hypothetical protein